ncbi:MAG: radical SAM protein [Clostridia bacterium]|nr:radical SAM protein [Clostridia bacterium]
MWEEPCITGNKGALAIFFSGCNLKCDYCQNFQISRGGVGEVYSIDEFVNIIEQNQDNHCFIDLITPTHFSDQLRQAFKKISKKIPVVWNTNGYESTTTIENVSEFVDVFLTDFKYSDNLLAEKFSKCKNYFEVCLDATKTMCALKTDKYENDLISQGVLIRHLVLPGLVKNSLAVLDCIKENFPERKISLMSQFTPNGQSELNRPLKAIEYKTVLAHAEKLQLTNGYFQDFSSASSNYIPKF